MGMMPPYDPFRDPTLLWAVARVSGCEPARPTWGTPAAVTLDVERALRGDVGGRLQALFDEPREAQQSRFYAERGASPEQAARELEALDRTPIEVPAIGERVIVWLARPAPPVPPPVLDPMGPPPFGPRLPATPPGGFWGVPTLRNFAPDELPIHSRWIDHTPDVEAVVLRRLGAG